MSLWDRFLGEFIDVIEWTDDSNDTLVYRFARHGNEIKNEAKLTVREGQKAVFVHEGRLADVFEPGMYALSTSNLPILSTLQHWDHGFNSPFKSEVYFVSTRQFTDQKWGTRNPIMLRDPEFGPVRVRTHGTYAMRIIDPGLFLREIVGTDGEFNTHEISQQVRNVIIARFSNALGRAGIPVLDIAAHTGELGNTLRQQISQELGEFGLSLTSLLVENVSLPAEVEQALDRRSSAALAGDLDRYTRVAMADSLRNQGGNPEMNSAVGLGLGMTMAQQMAQQLSQNNPPAAAPTPPQAMPPPLPNSQWHVAENGASTGPWGVAQLQQMASQGRINAATLVWRPGLDSWKPASSQAALAALLANVPPPLP